MQQIEMKNNELDQYIYLISEKTQQVLKDIDTIRRNRRIQEQDLQKTPKEQQMIFKNIEQISLKKICVSDSYFAHQHYLKHIQDDADLKGHFERVLQLISEQYASINGSKTLGDGYKIEMLNGNEKLIAVDIPGYHPNNFYFRYNGHIMSLEFVGYGHKDGHRIQPNVKCQ